MKTLIKLTVLISLFFGTLNAQDIKECKTDIYFGNGVWNSAKETKKSIDKLQYIIDTEVVNNDPKLKAKYGQIKLQYNWGQGRMLDVLETYYQLKEAGQVQDYQFFAVIALLTKGNPTLTLGAVASKELMEPFTRDWEQGNVDEMWQKYYDESFKLSHKVLLISHSQGNLFANRVYDKVNPTEYKSYFANMQIASPASEIKALKGDYVTLSTDLTSADPVINFIPGSMSPNASGESGHELVNAYLLQADPLSKITAKIKQLLANLDTESSQWELDNELNKGTKNYKITLKHRFDTAITSMQDVEVYPFNASKKLYHVIDNTGGNGWVKASCGGEEVFDSWTGQEDNESYLINNLEKEKIISNLNLYITGENGCTESNFQIINPNVNTKYDWWGWVENGKISLDTLSISVPYDACNVVHDSTIGIKPVGSSYMQVIQKFPRKQGHANIWFSKRNISQNGEVIYKIEWDHYVGSQVNWSTTHGNLTVFDNYAILNLGKGKVQSYACPRNFYAIVKAEVSPVCGECSSFTKTIAIGMCFIE